MGSLGRSRRTGLIDWTLRGLRGRSSSGRRPCAKWLSSLTRGRGLLGLLPETFVRGLAAVRPSVVVAVLHSSSVAEAHALMARTVPAATIDQSANWSLHDIGPLAPSRPHS